MSIKSKTQLREKREVLERESLTDNWHSRAYHHEFDGWVERPETDEKGRLRIRRVYAGEYYKAALSDTRWKLRRLWYLLALLASAALFILSAVGGGAQLAAWAVLPQVAAVFGYIFLFWFWMLRLFVPRVMTKGQRRSCARNLRFAALIAAVSLALCALGMLIAAVVLRGEWAALWSVGGFVLSGAAVFAVFRAEDRTDYEWIRNENRDTDGFAIREESL